MDGPSMADPVERLLARLNGVRRRGTGWEAHCPAHDDRRASLSIGRGWDRRALADCHAGCPTEQVLGVVGLTMADLFPDADEASPTPSVETVYAVRDATGTLHATHHRWDEPGSGKRVRWRGPSGAWGLAGRPTASLPLYGTERLAAWPVDAEPVFVVEGEKVADALLAAGRRALGTVTGAAIIPEREVLAVLAGRAVVLSPDNDPAGEAHMSGIAARLDGLGDVRWLDPSGWPDKADLADIIARGRSAHALHEMVANGHGLEVNGEVWADIERSLGPVPTQGGDSRDETDTTDRTGRQRGSGRSVPPDGWPDIEPLVPDDPLPPFPLQALPPWMAAMVQAVAANTETDPSMAAVTALGLASVPLSNRFQVQTKTWTERGVHLFTASIAESGELKSAVVAALDEPLREHERERQAQEQPQRRDKELARKDIEARVAIARDGLKRAMKDEVAARARAGRPPEDGEAADDAPVDDGVAEARQRIALARAHLKAVQAELDADEEAKTPPYALLADDATQEALQRQMAQQDGRTGIVSAESELFAMAAGRYTDKAPNLQVYLSGFSGDPLRADRITRDAPPVQHPGLAIVISTQPVVLEEARRNAHFLRRGLLARFMFAVPVSRAGTRHLAERPAVPTTVAREYRDALLRLCRLGDARHAGAPMVLLLVGEAGRRLESWHDGDLEPRRDRERGDLGASDAMAAWAARLHGLAVRIAGTLHVAEHGDQAGSVAIDVSVMERAITIAEWAVEHAFAAFGIDRLDRVGHDALRLRRWYRARPQPLATFSVRDACRGVRGLDADHVRGALRRLEEHGYLRLERSRPGLAGGRPSELVSVNPADLADA